MCGAWLFIILISLSQTTRGQSLKSGDVFQVEKKVLSNGMAVLVRPVHIIPKVSVQLWYHVGSKDERDRERGIAHLIEHMIFKGTEKLSESDINVITHLLSGNTNAFTSYDFTGYLFNLPSQHWEYALDIMADCMCNCRFEDDHLSSEMKAVIQELKMFRDMYTRSLADEMISLIFSDHPYHHPIIGYKQDLWSVSADDLKRFYQKHYIPNNATLVVVGDVDPEDVFQKAEKLFGSIPADPSYKRVQHYLNKDIAAKSVTLYRSVQQPIILYCFVIPGLIEKKDHSLELLARILASGKTSRLYKKLVDELQLASSVSAMAEELFDYGLFFIAVEPKRSEDIQKIEQVIQDEIRVLTRAGVTDDELDQAVKQLKMDQFEQLENTEHQAYEIGKYYLATQDPNYPFRELVSTPDLKKEIQQILVEYFRPSVMHAGKVLPLPAEEAAMWQKLQKDSDIEDKKILSIRQRTTEVEPPSFAKKIEVKKPGKFPFPKANHYALSNGLKLFYYDNKNTPKVDILLDVPTKHYRDPEGQDGLSQFVNQVMVEGTKNYPGSTFAHEIEKRGINLSCYPGGIALSVLSQDLPFGLKMLKELVTNAEFDEKKIEKVREQLLVKLKRFWDEPRYFAGQLVKEQIYQGHPYSKNPMGTVEGVRTITRDDLVNFYKTYFTPQSARIAIVGDLGEYNMQKLIEDTLGSWKGSTVEKIVFPSLKEISAKEVEYPIDRDQITLRFAGLSVDRKDPEFDKLLLFDQIFSGGALGSMSSRLFQLREQSGLFYTIGASTIAGSDEQPGRVTVQTIVSADRLKEAEKAISHCIKQTIETITEEELIDAKRAVAHTLVDNFASNANMAQAFLFLDRYSLPDDFFDKRAQQLEKISLQEVKKAAGNILDLDKMITLRVGRVSN